MPGKSWSGPLRPLTAGEEELTRTLLERVGFVAHEIGERNVTRCFAALERTARYIEETLSRGGLKPRSQTFECMGRECENVEVEIRGCRRPDEIVVVGAHYDTVAGSPGANDNGTGVAAALCLADAFAGRGPDRTVRFVFFANEEPPFFRTGSMGSLVYARRCRKRQEKVVAMIALETLGYYSDRKGSQSYPLPLGLFYPSTGNYVAFVGNVGSGGLVRRAVASFRRNACFPSEGGAVPGFLQGISWSDHWSFWETGYEALMVTDTAFLRYPHYHLPTDTPDKVDHARLARVVSGLEGVITDLSGTGR